MAKLSSHLSVEDPYNSLNDKDPIRLIKRSRQGINYLAFITLSKKSPFSLNEWSGFLHLSPRTLQRYHRLKKKFDPIYTEKIFQIILLYNYGIEVFGNREKLNAWLENNNLALGRIKPKELLDSSFGIELLRDELTRIEHGVLA